MSASHAAEQGAGDLQRANQRIPEPNLGRLEAHGHRGWRLLWPRALGAAIVRQILLWRA